MKSVTSKMKVARRVLTTVLGIAVSCAVASRYALAEDSNSAPPPAGNPAAVASSPGLMIYVDPQTGAFRREPAPGTVPLLVSPEFLNRLSTSHQGLVEALSSVPGGGVKVDLQGRFQSPTIATVDAKGKVKIQHLEPPESGGKK